MKRSDRFCSVCMINIEREDAPVLAMGHFGYPRLLCDDCEALIETALKSRDVEAVEEAMSRLGQNVSANSICDECVTEAIEEIFADATDRAKKIKDGTYDFALDEQENTDDEGFDEIPEELLETEEDKAAREHEEEVNRKFNKVMDIVTAVVFAAAIAVLIFYFIKR